PCGTMFRTGISGSASARRRPAEIGFVSDESEPRLPAFDRIRRNLMNALLLTEYMKLEMVDFPEPEIGPDDVLVRVRTCGICGRDVHGFDGSSGRRNPPLIMGHEAAGEIAK